MKNSTLLFFALLGVVVPSVLGLRIAQAAQEPAPASGPQSVVAARAPLASAAEEPSATAVAAVTAPPTAATVAAASDPNIDRGFILPTAMTQRSGSITYNNYELLFHGLTYGLTDSTQASLTVLSPIVSNMPIVGLASIKQRFALGDQFHMALQGSLGFASENGSNGSNGSVYNFGAGAFASLCLRSDCSSLLTASTTYSLTTPSGAQDAVHLVIYGVSIVHAVTPYLKLLGEVASATAAVDTGAFDNAPGALASYGARFHSDRMAADIGFMKPIASDGGADGFVMGFPFVSFSYRWR